mgnify:CR=1 FL=1|jgi:hypothetical protein
MGNIFICYRRDDSQFVTDRIFDHLIQHYPRKSLFKDVDDIPPGVDFQAHIEKAVARSTIMLAIIGPSWLSAKNAAGQRRLDDPDDFVYIELSTAIRLQRAILPILVGGARMPAAAELPSALQSLARINAVQVRSDPDFKGDFGRLQRALEGTSDRRHRSWLTPKAVAATLGIFLAIVAIVWYSRKPSVTGSTPLAPTNTPALGSLPPSQREHTIPPPKSSDGCVDVPFTDTSKFPPVTTTKRIC